MRESCLPPTRRCPGERRGPPPPPARPGSRDGGVVRGPVSVGKGELRPWVAAALASSFAGVRPPERANAQLKTRSAAPNPHRINLFFLMLLKHQGGGGSRGGGVVEILTTAVTNRNAPEVPGLQSLFCPATPKYNPPGKGSDRPTDRASAPAPSGRRGKVTWLMASLGATHRRAGTAVPAGWQPAALPGPPQGRTQLCSEKVAHVTTGSAGGGF